MKTITRILLALVGIAVCVYSINVFGSGVWTQAILLLSLFMMVSTFVAVLEPVAVMIARAVGLLALAGTGLLIVAGFIGGSFNLSESNQVMLVGMLAMAFLGCCHFFFPVEKNTDDQAPGA